MRAVAFLTERAARHAEKEVLNLVKYYRTIENHLCEIEKVESGCWISVIDPTETEISDLEEDLGIDRDYVRAALDEEEPSRIESDDGVTLIVVVVMVINLLVDISYAFLDPRIRLGGPSDKA